jgi:hypothetical protein
MSGAVNVETMPFPTIRPTLPFRRYLANRLVRAAHDPDRSAWMSLAELVASLGERSMGWALLVFALVNLLPLPMGSDTITAIPVLVVTVQIALGYDELRLPGFIARRHVGRKRFQKLVLRLGSVFRPIERALKPRLAWLFEPSAEQIFGAYLFVVALALAAPIPFTGYVPAVAIALAGIGLIERDGLVALAGAVLGLVGVGITIAAGTMLFAGAEALVR